MSQELLKAGQLMAVVHCVEIFRLKTGDDHVYLHTNLPNPRFPYQGGMSLHLICDRGTGQDWASSNFPDVEVHLYDHTVGRVRQTGNLPSAGRLVPAALLAEAS